MIKINQNFVFVCSWIATVLYFIVAPLTNVDFLITIIWVPIVVLNLFYCILNFRLIPMKTKVICLFLLYTMVSSMLLQGKLFSTAHYISIMCFLNGILCISLYSGKNMTISQKTKNFIKLCIVFLGLLFAVYSFSPIANMVKEDGISRVSRFFVFNLENSNMAGIFLFLIFSILFIFTFDADKKYKKVFYIGLDVYTIYLIYKTGARSCLIAVVALLLIGLFFRSKQINRLIICAVTFVPIVFVYLLTSLYSNGYQEVEVLGKSIFTGREIYFKECIDGIDTFFEWAIGDFGNWGLNNAHNAPLALLLSLGLIGLVLVYVVYYDVMFKLNSEKNPGKVKTICVVCIMCLFVESIAEASLFLGGFPGVNFICTMVVLGQESTEERSAREIPVANV